MKKHSLTILGLSLALVAAFTLASCQAGSASGGKVELSVLYYVDASAPGYANEVKSWDLVKEKTKGIADLKIEELFNEPFHQKTEAYAASGKMPDILYMWPSGRSGTLHSKKLVKDLTPLLGEEYLKAFAPGAIDPKAQAAGYLAELPNGVTATHVFYVNKPVLDKLGLTPATTYEELKAQAPKLKAAGLEVVLMANKDDWVMQSCLFSTVVGRIAGNEFIDAVVAGNAKFTDQPFVDSLKFIQTLYADGVLSKTSLQTGYGEVPGLFAAGKAAYYIDGDWRAGAFLTDPATKTALISPEDQKNILFTVFPTMPGEQSDAPGTSIVVGTGFGISSTVEAGSAKEKAAIEVIKALQSAEVQLIRLESGASFPSRTDVTSDKLEPLSVSRGAFYATTKGSYVLDGVLDPKVFTPLNIGLQEIGLGKTTPEALAAKVQKAFDDWKASM